MTKKKIIIIILTVIIILLGICAILISRHQAMKTVDKEITQPEIIENIEDTTINIEDEDGDKFEQEEEEPQEEPQVEEKDDTHYHDNDINYYQSESFLETVLNSIPGPLFKDMSALTDTGWLMGLVEIYYNVADEKIKLIDVYYCEDSKKALYLCHTENDNVVALYTYYTAYKINNEYIPYIAYDDIRYTEQVQNVADTKMKKVYTFDNSSIIIEAVNNKEIIQRAVTIQEHIDKEKNEQ